MIKRKAKPRKDILELFFPDLDACLCHSLLGFVKAGNHSSLFRIEVHMRSTTLTRLFFVSQVGYKINLKLGPLSISPDSKHCLRVRNTLLGNTRRNRGNRETILTEVYVGT